MYYLIKGYKKDEKYDNKEIFLFPTRAQRVKTLVTRHYSNMHRCMNIKKILKAVQKDVTFWR